VTRKGAIVGLEFSARSQAPLGNAVLEALLPVAMTWEAELPVPGSQAELGNQRKNVTKSGF